jgi:butyryl-CoA dehydrogenase
MDLVGRKIGRDGGQTAKAWLAEIGKLDSELKSSGLDSVAKNLAAGVQAVADCVDYIVAEKNPAGPFAGAVPFLRLMGIVAGGWQMARAALVSRKKLSNKEPQDKSFLEAKIATAQFYSDHLLVQAPGLRDTVVKGSAGVMALGEDQFLAA